MSSSAPCRGAVTTSIALDAVDPGGRSTTDDLRQPRSEAGPHGVPSATSVRHEPTSGASRDGRDHPAPRRVERRHADQPVAAEGQRSDRFAAGHDRPPLAGRHARAQRCEVHLDVAPADHGVQQQVRPVRCDTSTLGPGLGRGEVVPHQRVVVPVGAQRWYEPFGGTRRPPGSGCSRSRCRPGAQRDAGRPAVGDLVGQQRPRRRRRRPAARLFSVPPSLTCRRRRGRPSSDGSNQSIAAAASAARRGGIERRTVAPPPSGDADAPTGDEAELLAAGGRSSTNSRSPRTWQPPARRRLHQRDKALVPPGRSGRASSASRVLSFCAATHCGTSGESPASSHR